ncbi:MAG: GH3 auxin-responsive promoter family protein [Chitinophagaceae bacterium]|nr:GH3 auxin-responsive promoter family protein [Chitinophagaceae bacterium]MEA3425708.1 GH3 auxin-responsive promoter family protein [Bacteroidota bacterium]MCA6453931.1 GH3 auxin-responsive promoter family protein [Chitinophagaceae bacterium]MCA6455826.1 GH3 auxin-responsive promoter family protein [Chitinophagaceae bacterium]MCA6459127.1 GH3 auxin-responsive promoter family protein [Chitinophagaceae bacterium]
MKLFSPAISRLARFRHWRIEQWINDPIGSQREVLQDLVTHGQYTDFGRKYGFKELFNIRTFKERVPIQEYNDLKPLIERLMAGEENMLWNTPVNWFAKSSGTTSDKSKFIPITQESLEDNHFQASKDVLTLYYNFNNESNLLTGKGLVIGGSHQISKLNEDIQYGDLSAVLLQNTPMWANWIRTPELSIALMDEWESKIERLAQSTIQEDVTSISGVPTWTLILIKRILEITGKATLKEVWPNLELYIHGGVSFVPYREQFEKVIGEGCTYLEMYNASEGFFAGQDNPHEDGMLLFLNHGIFYEFMPVEEYGKPEPRTIGLREVEIGKNYALIISTNGGLWRYLVGDTVQFTSTFPFRIKVSGRLKQYINAFGEEVIADNTDKAIAMASQKTGLVVNDYTAAPVYFGDNQKGAHEWLIEFEEKPASTEQFAYELDCALKSLNSDYEAKRYKDIALTLPIVHALNKTVFREWLKSKGKLGGQHKVPRLSNDRRFVDDILSFL